MRLLAPLSRRGVGRRAGLSSPSRHAGSRRWPHRRRGAVAAPRRPAALLGSTRNESPLRHSARSNGWLDGQECRSRDGDVTRHAPPRASPYPPRAASVQAIAAPPHVGVVFFLKVRWAAAAAALVLRPREIGLAHQAALASNAKDGEGRRAAACTRAPRAPRRPAHCTALHCTAAIEEDGRRAGPRLATSDPPSLPRRAATWRCRRGGGRRWRPAATWGTTARGWRCKCKAATWR
eukprot:scaffold2823_cov373-Prasinococcus_capsulatus_cf.AAC.7